MIKEGNGKRGERVEGSVRKMNEKGTGTRRVKVEIRRRPDQADKGRKKRERNKEKKKRKTRRIDKCGNRNHAYIQQVQV